MSDPKHPEHPSWAALVEDDAQPWQTLGRQELSRERRFVRDRVRLHGGGEEDYLYHPRGPRAVFVLPVTVAGEGVFIEQYRYPLRATITELVAGGVEEGEDLLEAAQRELSEEVGGVAGRWEALPGFYPQPSISGAVFFPYLALDVTLREPQNEESELITRRVLPLSTLYDLLDEGRIQNGPSALVLYQARLRLHKLGLL